MPEGEFGGLFGKVRGMIDVQKKVEASNGKAYYPYSVETSENTKLRRIFTREPHADKLFLLNLAANSEQYFALLKDLQELGFDIYAMMSSPKGDDLSPIHGDINLLESNLKKIQSGDEAHSSALRNKLQLKGYFERGRLHLRFFAVEQMTVVSAHVDPPDLVDHINPIKHINGTIKTDYPTGQDLFCTTLDVLNSRQ